MSGYRKNLKPIEGVITAHTLQLLAALLLFVGGSGAAAETTGGTTDDGCEVGDIEVVTPTNAETENERVARLDGAFFTSLRKFDDCQFQQKNSSGGGGGNGGAAASSTAIGTGDSGGNAANLGNKSEAADKAAATEQQRKNTKSATLSEDAKMNDATKVKDAAKGAASPHNGMLPKDIPDGNDDDVVARQIREAALSEQDPSLRDKLWNEYRLYKGLGSHTE